MPRGDRTGPMGFGPMTGRAMGYCAGYSVPGYANPIGGGYGFGRGFGMGRGYRGRGGGFGFRHRYYATGLPYWARSGPGWEYPPVSYPQEVYPYEGALSPEQEMGALKEQSKDIKNILKDIEKRMESLKSKLEKEKK